VNLQASLAPSGPWFRTLVRPPLVSSSGGNPQTQERNHRQRQRRRAMNCAPHARPRAARPEMLSVRGQPHGAGNWPTASVGEFRVHQSHVFFKGIIAIVDT